jgi:hypothetical protein
MIPLDDIVGLIAGDLSPERADQVEEHLFGCSTCSAAAAWLASLGDAVRTLAHDGRIELIDTHAFREQLERDGIPFGFYRLTPNQEVACSVGAAEVYNLLELEADLRGVSRVDGEMFGPGGVVLQTLNDIPFTPERNLVVIAARADRLRRMPDTRFSVRLTAVDGEVRRVIADYFLDHHA